MLQWETNLIIKSPSNINDSHLILLTVMHNCLCLLQWSLALWICSNVHEVFSCPRGTQSLFESRRAHIVSEKCILLEIPFYACTFTQYPYWYQGICKKCKPILNICLENSMHLTLSSLCFLSDIKGLLI